MAIEILSKAAQINSDVNDEEIFINKPIGFPNETSELAPISNLFYIVNAETEEGSTIKMHEHKGFEVLTLVHRGYWDYYDMITKKWNRLVTGEVQFLKPGKGYVHSERLGQSSHITQIWFDPNLQKSLLREPLVSDYKNSDFHTIDSGNKRVKTIIGGTSLISPDSDEISVKEITLFHGTHLIALEAYSYYSFYIAKGDIEVNTKIVTEEDFMIIKDEADLEITCGRETKLIMIETPKTLKYKTYAQIFPDKYSD